MQEHLASRREKGRTQMKFENGRLYFSKEMERKFFFILTIVMLGLGACFKLGVL